MIGSALVDRGRRAALAHRADRRSRRRLAVCCGARSSNGSPPRRGGGEPTSLPHAYEAALKTTLRIVFCASNFVLSHFLAIFVIFPISFARSPALTSLRLTLPSLLTSLRPKVTWTLVSA